ncbi:MAG TPA: methyltransferase domain-containing protein [Methylomirabilota bacterium]|jgi:trans-aconitate 2-methyltransferase|nr:methyltransferase domain-containing protein [Methylomirabilota bacterium]
MPSWDPQQYQRFSGERSRPFFDLLARVPEGEVRYAADLGCGPGNLTATLVERWPEAAVWGVDNSPDMLAAAATLPAHERLFFIQADLAMWRPDRPLDRIVSNAAIQWVPDHEQVLAHLYSLLAPGGVLAVQMPNNFDEPAHRLLAEVVRQEPWAAAIGHWQERYFVQNAGWYADTLHRLGFVNVDVWETIYYHILQGPDAVLEWMKGTALRPVFTRLALERHHEFLANYGAKLRAAYPARSYGTLLPFRRLFFVARRYYAS